MSYLIIVIVVMLVLSPVFWIMPSPAQKRQMQLRQQAMTLGFMVKITDLPQSHRAKVRKEKVEQGVAYRLPWEVKRKHPQGGEYLLMRDTAETPSGLDNSNFSRQMHLLMQDTLLQLPNSVVALEYAAPGLALYWREHGDVELISSLYQQLIELRRAALDLESSI